MSLRLVYVVLEPPLLAAVAAAADRAQAESGLAFATHGFLLHDLVQAESWGRFTRALEGADIFLGAVLNLDAEVRRLAEALGPRRPPVTAVFHSQAEALSLNRVGDFDALTWREDGSFGRLLRHLRERGAPLPGLVNVVLAAVPHLEGLLPPGEFSGLRAYARASRLWLEGTGDALTALLLHLANQHPRYAGRVEVPPVEPLPQVALWHPAAGRSFADLADYQAWYAAHRPDLAGAPKVAVLCHRRWVAVGDTAHYAAAVAALEQQGLAAWPAFSDMDVTPLVQRFWQPAGVQLLLNLTSFNLVGGHGRPSPEKAVEALSSLDVPYLAAVPLIFQRLEQWREGQSGLTAPQLVMQVVMPELEGGAEPWVYAGPTENGAMQAAPAETERLARRVRAWVDLRQTPPAERKLAITLFSNPPGKGALGTAAYLDVFASLWQLLRELRDEGYTVELPPSPQALLEAVLGGEGVRFGAGELPVAGRLSVAEYRQLVPGWQRIARCWGPPPGEVDTDGTDLLIFGKALGNVFVGVQPSFGYDGDPLRLLFHPDAAPSHAFAAYYAWIRARFGAQAVLHFGTHGALEFMPGKQAGLSADCWPAALVGDLPHLYYYAANNPSEASIAKRRGGAVTVGHRTPPLAAAGLYRTLAELQETLLAWRRAEAEISRAGAWSALLSLVERAALTEEVPPPAEPADPAAQQAYVDRLGAYLAELAARRIPVGLHVAGSAPEPEQEVELLAAAAWVSRPEWGGRSLPELVAESARPPAATAEGAATAAAEGAARELLQALVAEGPAAAAARAESLGLEAWPAKVGPLLESLLAGLRADQELAMLRRALGGRYIPPGPGGDLVRNPAVLPTGRNLHALDPWRVPSQAAWRAGQLAVDRLLARLQQPPEAVALVLWGSDNIKTAGEGIAQALWLMGCAPEADSLGRITRVRLVPLAELGRPRIDAVVTCSGIFRDLFPGTMQLLQEAARLAALADEPDEQNLVRKHARELAEELQIPLAEAAARVFAAAPGQYGTGVNHLVGEGAWEQAGDLAETYVRRMGHAWGEAGGGREARKVLAGLLRRAPVTLQNVDSTEVSLADVDHYFEHLGGLTAAVSALRGRRPEAMVVDGTTGRGEVRTLKEAVRLEVRTRLLNPRWYEGMLRHGYQGVNEVAVRLDNTYGWLATTGQVDGWALDMAADTFVLDAQMRRRMAALNPRAVRRMAERLLEAAARGLWQTGADRVAALRAALDELDDAIEALTGEPA